MHWLLPTRKGLTAGVNNKLKSLGRNDGELREKGI